VVSGESLHDADPGEEGPPDARIGDVTSSIEQALAADRVIDITTTGRKTGDARRIEIWYHRVDGRLYITGTPGARAWYANLLEHPDFTFHLKESAQADLPARATPVLGAEKRRVLAAIAASLSGRLTLDDETSPLVEVTIAAAAA
jgi:deazaflavin-dependent oxidoreductase (nitroreductase family)